MVIDGRVSRWNGACVCVCGRERTSLNKCDLRNKIQSRCPVSVTDFSGRGWKRKSKPHIKSYLLRVNTNPRPATGFVPTHIY